MLKRSPNFRSASILTNAVLITIRPEEVKDVLSEVQLARWKELLPNSDQAGAAGPGAAPANVEAIQVDGNGNAVMLFDDGRVIQMRDGAQ